MIVVRDVLVIVPLRGTTPSMEDLAGNGTTTEGQGIEEPDSGTIMAGQVIDVPNSERSGLLATAKLYLCST